jgi:hypothetical protein
MKTKLNILLSILFFTFIFLNGCGGEDAPVLDPLAPPPPCVDTINKRRPTIEYDYMYDTDENYRYTLFKSGGAKFKRGLKRAGVEAVYNPRDGSANTYYVPEGGSTGEEIEDWLIAYADTNFNNNGTGYNVGIDNFAENINTAGLKAWSYNYAVVMVGLLENTYPSFGNAAVEKTLTHEMGHMLGLMPDGDIHTGRYADTCVMYQGHFYLNDPVLVFCTFCDKHCCDVYNNSFGRIAGNMNNASNFDMIISMNKKNYLSLEPIWVTIKIKNNSSHIDSLENLNDVELLKQLILKSTKGERIQYHGLIAFYAFSVWTKFSPNEELTYDIEINNGYGNVTIDKPIAHSTNAYFDQGEYTISSYFYQGINPFNSNQLSFMVNVPVGTEAEVFNQLVDIYKKHGEKVTNYSKKADELKNLYDKYPQSIYSEQIFNHYSGIMAFNMSNLTASFLDDCITFFQKHPDSYYSHKILRNCIRAFVKINGKDKTKLISFLENIKQQFPSSKISENAETSTD